LTVLAPTFATTGTTVTDVHRDHGAGVIQFSLCGPIHRHNRAHPVRCTDVNREYSRTLFPSLHYAVLPVTAKADGGSQRTACINPDFIDSSR